MYFIRAAFCLLFFAYGAESSNVAWNIFNSTRAMMKESINKGATTISKGMAVGNSVVQTGTSLMTNGLESGRMVGKMIAGTGTALTGHTLAVGSSKAIEATNKIDDVMKKVPFIGNIVRLGNDRVRQGISSINRIGQASMNSMDAMTDAYLSLANSATQVGANVVSKSSKLGTTFGQASVAVGNSLLQTGVDNAFTLTQNIADQLISGKFNVSALGNNLSTGSKWILNDNTKLALSNFLPALNQTLS